MIAPDESYCVVVIDGKATCMQVSDNQQLSTTHPYVVSKDLNVVIAGASAMGVTAAEADFEDEADSAEGEL